MGFATPKACFVCFSVYAFCFRRLLSSILPFSRITYTNRATPCGLLKWLGPCSRPQVNALRSEFYFVGCQDGGHAFKNIFTIFAYLFCVMWVHVEVRGELVGPRLGERHPELFCWLDPFMSVIWLLRLSVMFSILYPLFYDVFINPLRIPSMCFDILFLFLSSSQTVPSLFTHPISRSFFPLKRFFFLPL